MLKHEKAPKKLEPIDLPVYHGDDAVASVNRAKKIDGYAIKSLSPDRETMGYWSDTSGFLRSWEQQVWPRRR